MALFSQQVIWTALPNGYSEKGLAVSVAISPRLSVDGSAVAQLGRFPAWSDWPRVISKARFNVMFNRERRVARLISRPDSRIWREIFDKETTVEDHRFEDLSQRVLIAYPFRELAKLLRDAMIEVAGRHSGRLPPADLLGPVIGHLANAPHGSHLLKNFASGGKGYLGELEKAGAADLGLFHAYHAPFQTEDNGRAGQEDARAIEAGMDFHKLVAALGQYRRLLRDTGLVLDLQIDEPFRPGKGPLTVAVDWAGGRGVSTLPDVYPGTMTRLDKRSFDSIPQNVPMVDRRIDLSDEAYGAEQIDVDGGILKFTGTAATLQSRTDNAARNGGTPPKDETPTALPPLRSAGIIVAESGRADTLQARLERATGFDRALTQRKNILLHAEDVMRGMHVDVHHKKSWYSLCRTDVSYQFSRAGIKLIDEDCEGIVQLGVSEPGRGAPSHLGSLMKLHEGLFNWDGWSLAAPRPGLAVDADGLPGREEITGGLPVAAQTTAHRRSLPTLRFGEDYRFRIRAVDLAHNAEDWSAQTKGGETDPITFHRFEPLQPPVPALVRALDELGRIKVRTPVLGESLTRIVIRSFDAQMDVHTDDVSERMLFPPRASAEMCERHGVLDDASGRPKASMYSRLAAQDADLDEHIGGTPDSEMKYPVADRAKAIAPYLPDPAAIEIRADMESEPKRRNTGGRNDNAVYVTAPWGSAWPDHAPIVLHLFEDDDDPFPFVPHQQTEFDIEARTNWNDATRTLSVALPKGETVLMDLRHSFPNKPEPANIWGIAAWLRDALTTEHYDSVKSDINAGQHWAITPAMRLELIHATQRPLVTPQPTVHVAPRSAGDTTADLTVHSPLHAESSADITLDARWIDPVDTLAEPPASRKGMARVMRDTLSPTRTPNGTISTHPTHQFGDTRYRRIEYTLSASSRFAEYFPSGIRDSRDAISVSSDPVERHVMNAAPPPPPRVARSIPVFDWLRDSFGSQQASFRRSGVRVYLERPWFETGFGEMLAAVVPRDEDHGGASGLSETLAQHVSRWGADPIWRRDADAKVSTPSPGLAAFPARSQPGDGPDDRWPDLFPPEERDLPAGLQRFQDLELPDEDGQAVAQVHAAGHPVSWNREQGLYMADVMMNPGLAYQPFVELAVARMHPISADGCHLSPSVRLPVMQILPSRLARARKFSTGWSIQLYGHRHKNTNTENDRARQSVIRAEVQRSSASEPDELDWETVDDPNIAMPPVQVLVSRTSSTKFPSSVHSSTLFLGRTGELRDAAQDFIEEEPFRLFTRLIKAPGAGGGARGTYNWRIMISEWERHANDGGVTAINQVPSDHERLIFAESFEI